MEETMSTRRQKMKADARSLMDSHFKFYLLLFLPIFILWVAAYVPSYAIQLSEPNALANSTGVDYLNILSIVASLLMIGVSFVLIDLQRGTTDYSSPVSKSFTIFNRGSYFLGTIGLAIMVFIFTLLWSLLLIVPGVIKSFSYSQAYYIYRDHIDQDDKIGILQAITESRQLMDGHKWEYFVMQLSFIGWGLACIIVIPIIWVVPYQQQSFANFYVRLVADQANVGQTDGTAEEDGPTVIAPSDASNTSSEAPKSDQSVSSSADAPSDSAHYDRPTETFYPDAKSSDDSDKN